MTVKLLFELDDESGGWKAKSRLPGLLIAIVAPTIPEVEQKARDLIRDYLANEGREDARWEGVTAESVIFEHIGTQPGKMYPTPIYRPPTGIDCPGFF